MQSSVLWPLKCTQTVSLRSLQVMELLASGSHTSTMAERFRKRAWCFLHPSFDRLYKVTTGLSNFFFLNCRKWNKETFDYLVSCLRSPESVKMGIFLQSGYNLLTEPAPVSSALFSVWPLGIRPEPLVEAFYNQEQRLVKLQHQYFLIYYTLVQHVP